MTQRRSVRSAGQPTNGSFLNVTRIIRPVALKAHICSKYFLEKNYFVNFVYLSFLQEAETSQDAWNRKQSGKPPGGSRDKISHLINIHFNLFCSLLVV